MTTALGLLAVLALILANGYFVAAEFAYVAVRRGRLEELAASGDRRASVALRVLKRLSFVLSGAQLGITVTSLAIGAIAEPVFGAALSPLFEAFGIPDEAAFGVALAFGLVVSTGLQMVLGELGPKNLAIAKPEAFAIGLARSTMLYTRLASPLITLFDSSSNRLLRSLGIEPVDEIPGGVSSEELAIIVAESRKEGSLSVGQSTLLGRALDFRGLRATDAMVARPQIVTLQADATCDDLRATAVASGHSRFPVVGDDLDDLKGIVQAKDVFAVPYAARGSTLVGDLAAPPLVVPESTLLTVLLGELRSARTQMAVVVDEFGGTAGVVTLEDIVEELVGEIQDEHDRPEAGVARQDDGSWLVPGRLRIDETERDLGIVLPDGDYDSLGGLVMATLERMPHVGDQVTVDGIRLCVEEMDGRAIAQVRVAVAGDADGSETGVSA